MLRNFKISLASYIKAFRQAKPSSVMPGWTKPAQPLKGYYYHSPGIIKISPNILSYKTRVE